MILYKHFAPEGASGEEILIVEALVLVLLLFLV